MCENKYYLFYYVNYEEHERTCETLDEVLEALDRLAQKHDELSFRVICGYEVEFEVAEVVKSYRPKK